MPEHLSVGMETAIIKAALSVVGTALAPFRDTLLENWAATKNLGSNVKELKLELLAVKALLEPTAGKEIADNSALKDLLVQLQGLGYDAEDVLDELDYFRIQDELHSTFEAANEHAKGCACNLALNLRHTAKAVAAACFCAATPGRKTRLTSAACCNLIRDVGKHFPCSSLQPVRDEPPKLRFNRVDASRRMKHIIKELQDLRQIVSSTITTLGPNNLITVSDIAQGRPITTSDSIEPKLYGRDDILKTIIHDITEGTHSQKVLTVIPVVGLGGIGKTTLVQHIYHSEEVQKHFKVKAWKCVSLNFDANRLIEEIKNRIPEVDGETKTDTASELIGKRLKNKRFLLVLDDIWDCSNEDEWKRLLLPFNKSQVHGNIIMITTRFPAQAEIMVQNNDLPIDLQGLDNEEFKKLFLDIVFGHGTSRIKVDESLLDIFWDKIVGKLKGSPLAAKTVGRLLKKQLDKHHWETVLDSKEWERSNGKDDIMPALKLSYYYLPSQLQRCFSYCALFPQDHKFKREDLINFWIGLDVLHSSHGETERLEDVGLRYLTELVGHGFFEKEGKEDESACYIVHDLLHDLARKVSSHECLTIYISQSQVISSLQFPPSIRHLSINVDDTSVKDRLTFNNWVENLNKLGKSLKIEKVRSLVLFGKHHSCFVKAFGDLFREAKALRVVFLSEASYGLEDLLLNFYNLIHLRYLRIGYSWPPGTLHANKLSRIYHMMIIDAKYCHINDLPRDMSNLAKLRHFVVKDDATHSSIAEVGKLTSLQELRRFVVKQEGQGFELRQIGHLAELHGTLCISNLENVRVKEEADEAKLMHKHHLQGLKLHWNIDRSTCNFELEEHVLERLEPSSYLQELCIIGHGGAICPSWLGMNLSVESLESLRLDGVSWKTFPPLGWLLDVPLQPHQDIPIDIPDKRLQKLRRLEFVNLPLKTWVVHAPCQLLPLLEVLIIKDCSQLEEVSFSHSACCPQEREALLFRQLTDLGIINCPQLSKFPAVPWTEAPCSVEIKGTNIGTLDELACKNYSKRYSLEINGKDNSDGTFWDVLDFRNLTKLTELWMYKCQPPPLHYLQVLSSLRQLRMSCVNNAVPLLEGNSLVKYQFPVEKLTIYQWGVSGKELTQLLTYFPKLTDLLLQRCKNITGLGVMGQEATTIPGPSSSANKLDKAQIEQDARAGRKSLQGTWRRRRRAVVTKVPEEGLLLVPSQLQKLSIEDSPKLHIQRGRGGLQGLSFLRSLQIENCSKLLCSWPSSFSSCFPFPNSLEYLKLNGVVAEETRVPLSNLSSLTYLLIYNCGDLRGDGLFSLLTQGHLTTLNVVSTPNFFDDFRTSRSPVFEQEPASSSSKLQDLRMDDVAGVTAMAMPMRSLLFSSLTKLRIEGDKEVDSFTEEQEAFQFVNSLEDIGFEHCSRLKYLPARLHILPRLRRLRIWACDAIQIRTEDRLPSSLQELWIFKCPGIKSLPKDWLPNSLQKLVITSCPAIQSLPKADDLPSSLRELDVLYSGSEELKKQCRKLIGIIPIIIAD